MEKVRISLVSIARRRKGREDVIRCPKDSIGETQEIGQISPLVLTASVEMTESETAGAKRCAGEKRVILTRHTDGG